MKNFDKNKFSEENIKSSASLKKSNSILLVIGTVGIILMAIAFNKKANSKESYKYQTTEGIITVCKSSTHFNNTTEGTELESKYHFQYKYDVYGNTYYSETISFNKTIEKNNFKNYSVGLKIKVYYDKENPFKAVLIPAEYQLYNSEYMITGILCLIVSVSFLIMNYKTNPAHKNK